MYGNDSRFTTVFQNKGFSSENVNVRNNTDGANILFLEDDLYQTIFSASEKFSGIEYHRNTYEKRMVNPVLKNVDNVTDFMRHENYVETTTTSDNDGDHEQSENQQESNSTQTTTIAATTSSSTTTTTTTTTPTTTTTTTTSTTTTTTTFTTSTTKTYVCTKTQPTTVSTTESSTTTTTTITELTTTASKTTIRRTSKPPSTTIATSTEEETIFNDLDPSELGHYDKLRDTTTMKTLESPETSTTVFTTDMTPETIQSADSSLRNNTQLSILLLPLGHGMYFPFSPESDNNLSINSVVFDLQP